MRTRSFLLVISLLAAPAFADDAKPAEPLYEPQTYRFGGTYLSEDAASPTGCSEVCAHDPFCKSWSFLKFQSEMASGTCELKHTIGFAERNPTSTSGISPRIEARFSTGSSSQTDELLGAHMQQRVRTVFAEPVVYKSAGSRKPGVYLNGERVPYSEIALR